MCKKDEQPKKEITVMGVLTTVTNFIMKINIRAGQAKVRKMEENLKQK